MSEKPNSPLEDIVDALVGNHRLPSHLQSSVVKSLAGVEGSLDVVGEQIGSLIGNMPDMSSPSAHLERIANILERIADTLGAIEEKLE